MDNDPIEGEFKVVDPPDAKPPVPWSPLNPDHSKDWWAIAIVVLIILRVVFSGSGAHHGP